MHQHLVQFLQERASHHHVSCHIGSDTKSEDEMNQMSDAVEDSDDNPVSTEYLQPLSEELDFVPAPEILSWILICW